MEIIVPIGISGSGKTRLYNMRYKDLYLLSPDLIRKELTGSISDQKKNKEVFEEVDRRVADLVKKGESFFYDATNVNSNTAKKKNATSLNIIHSPHQEMKMYSTSSPIRPRSMRKPMIWS